MKNKKGLASLVALFLLVYSTIGTVGILNLVLIVTPLTEVCAWHIPAWEAAKKYHCEKEYQAGDMNCGYRKAKNEQ